MATLCQFFLLTFTLQPHVTYTQSKNAVHEDLHDIYTQTEITDNEDLYDLCDCDDTYETIHIDTECRETYYYYDMISVPEPRTSNQCTFNSAFPLPTTHQTRFAIGDDMGLGIGLGIYLPTCGGAERDLQKARLAGIFADGPIQKEPVQYRRKFAPPFYQNSPYRFAFIYSNVGKYNAQMKDIGIYRRSRVVRGRLVLFQAPFCDMFGIF